MAENLLSWPLILTTNQPAVADTIAMEMEANAFGKIITNHLQDATRKSTAIETTFKAHEGVLLALTILLVLFAIMLRFGRRFIGSVLKREKNSTLDSRAAAVAAESQTGEEEAFAKFASSFRVGPKKLTSDTAVTKPVTATANTLDQKATQPAATSCNPNESLALIRSRLTSCRNLVQEVGKTNAEAVKATVMIELAAAARAVKDNASHPDLLAIWQTVSCLEGLLKQLTDKPAAINASTLRTVAGSIDLLSRLSSAGRLPDLLKNPPVRFLAVDDDPITRHTVSFALRRALTAPDLAENGPQGLTLATNNVYDVIFLDVQMPEMDGFELCKKIRAGEANRSTPIVFVTCQSDFNSRAQSSLAGGCDLIGKPFLAFEVATKALILSLGNRLTRASVKPAELVPA